MRLVNLHNYNRTIYKFIRNEDQSLSIITDDSYWPYAYRKNPNGIYTGYLDGKKYEKIVQPHPRDIKKLGPQFLGTDIPYTKNYILDNIPQLTHTNPRVVYMDLEVKTDRMPQDGDYSKPISSIAIYDSYTNKDYVWFIGDLNGTIRQREKIVIDSFCEKIQELQPDIMAVWNGGRFDYPYLQGRDKFWARKCSPVNLDRYGFRTDNGEFIKLPIGISCIDLLQYFKKWSLNKWESYNLEDTLTREFGKGKLYHDVEFDKITDDIKERNRNDVIDLHRLNKKHKVIEFFNQIRIETFCDFEELQSKDTKDPKYGIKYQSNNSRLMDTAAILETKKRKMVLPNKPHNIIKEKFHGAERETFECGRFRDCQKADLGTAYPFAAYDFCLDPINLVDEPNENTITIPVKDRLTGEVTDNFHFIQNKDALIPTIIKKAIDNKERVKKELKSLDPSTKEYEMKEIEYAAKKAQLNSYYGSLGEIHNRLFNINIAKTVTFIARDILYNAESKLRELNKKIIFRDTDSYVYQSNENLTDELNNNILEWAKSYSLNSTSILFESEGKFSLLFTLAKCHYLGLLINNRGQEKWERKGIEAVSNAYSKYVKWFQLELLQERLLKKWQSKEEILEWIIEERKKFKDLPLEDIAVPAKVLHTDYKTENKNGQKLDIPYRVKAFNNANKYSKKQIEFGQIFYIIKMKPPIGYIGFKYNTDHIDRELIDWEHMLKLSIDNKAKPVFKIMNWDYNISGQMELEL